IGRVIGGRFGDKVSGGQALGQKNTVLAVWIALAYLNPISSIAPAAYIAWQNIINSWQLMRHQRQLHTAGNPSKP
ncbi:MAG: transporter, partial [Muribaculaceae bacterium]|nr:transporter [Muribaculaceae bacterium]